MTDAPPMTWKRINSGADVGYQRGNARVLDNGCGLGPSSGSGRWAVEIDGQWVANVDTLASAKERASERCTCGSENLFSGYFDADDLAVSDDSAPGTRYTTFCNECGTEQA